MDEIHDWIAVPPNHSSFRVNTLKQFNSDTLKNFLETQRVTLEAHQIPKFYFLTKDCLILEQWAENVSVEKTGNEVIVDAFCAAAVLRGANVYAPGVLGFPTNCKINDRVDIYGDLDGQCRRGLKVKYDGRKTFVGTGLIKMLRYELFDNGIQPNGIAIETLLPLSRIPVVNSTLYPNGEVVLQNLPSIVCGWVLNPQPSETILDMCAAPGNKTTHLAEISHDKAIITAIDKTAQKVAKIKDNCLVQGITCVNAFVFDSTKCYADGTHEGVGPPFPENHFDKVLLDAPCSGLGQRPQLVNKMTQSQIKSYKFVQRKLFTAAVKVLKEDGMLVYSTCTITEEENEEMVAWALNKFPCLMLVPAEPLLGGPGLPDKGLSDQQRVMVQRFGPENDPLRPVENIYKGSIGFFIATFVKIPKHTLN